jgi:hypothetical protein
VNKLLISAVAAALFAGTASAQTPRVQTFEEALAQDAGEYARQNQVGIDEARRRLRAQEESVAATDAIRDSYRHRLAGISIEHSPQYRIAVLLTGSEPVADREIVAGGMKVPIVFRTGAAATGEQVISAFMHQRDRIKAALPNVSGAGLDPRTGELVLMVKTADANRYGPGELDSAMETLTGVPVRIRVLDRTDLNSSVEGGARVTGVDPANGKRYACTTGFVVGKGPRRGIVTAAHCPDALTYIGPQGRTELSFDGQWGWRYQDVQVHSTSEAARPLFYADSAKTLLRTVTGARARTSTRAGDFVCRRGETTGYSCAQVELVDYAPPGELCGGPCDPVWVTVPGPACKGGDSGAPIFLGTVAFGIVKGGNYSRTGICNFYYYMSTDYLPDGWGLLRG